MPVHPATFPQFTVDMMSLRKYRLTGPSAGASAHLLVGTSPEHTLRYPTTTLGAEVLQHPHPIIGEPSECNPKEPDGPRNQALGGRRGRARKPQRRGSPHKRCTYWLRQFKTRGPKHSSGEHRHRRGATEQGAARVPEVPSPFPYCKI